MGAFKSPTDKFGLMMICLTDASIEMQWLTGRSMRMDRSEMNGISLSPHSSSQHHRLSRGHYVI